MTTRSLWEKPFHSFSGPWELLCVIVSLGNVFEALKVVTEKPFYGTDLSSNNLNLAILHLVIQ